VFPQGSLSWTAGGDDLSQDPAFVCSTCQTHTIPVGTPESPFISLSIEKLNQHPFSSTENTSPHCRSCIRPQIPHRIPNNAHPLCRHSIHPCRIPCNEIAFMSQTDVIYTPVSHPKVMLLNSIPVQCRHSIYLTLNAIVITSYIL
jgi:hypothetical protein